MEERPPTWRVAANILNKQSLTADKGWSSSLGVGRGANNSSPRKRISVTKYSQTNPPTWTENLVDLSSGRCGGMDWIELAKFRERCRALVNAVMNLRVA
jgi:hypothetical protein